MALCVVVCWLITYDIMIGCESCWPAISDTNKSCYQGFTLPGRSCLSCYYKKISSMASSFYFPLYMSIDIEASALNIGSTSINVTLVSESKNRTNMNFEQESLPKSYKYYSLSHSKPRDMLTLSWNNLFYTVLLSEVLYIKILLEICIWLRITWTCLIKLRIYLLQQNVILHRLI